MSHFNYIVTCHNSEALIDRVLVGVQRCINGGAVGTGATCVVVLDGCTDRTEELVSAYPWVQIVETPDVHELLSINAGLRAAPQDGDGYNIILQDDVILEEPRLEELVEKLYATIPRLGYVSFRLAHNLGPDDPSNPYLILCDEIESLYGAGAAGDTLVPYRFAERACVIKSPVCLPCKLVRELGMFDEALAPYGYDDLDYSIRAHQAGYVQGVFSIPFQSDVRWGGSRRPGHPDIQPTVIRNAAYLRKKHTAIIEQGLAFDCFHAEIADPEPKLAEARARWEKSKATLKELNP
jgi:hypothetical protein